MRNARKLVVEIVVDADNDAEATDGIGEMLRANEQRLHPEADRYQAAVIDWQFVGEPVPVEVPDRVDYVEGEVFAGLA
jgi:hypothetical protein